MMQSLSFINQFLTDSKSLRYAQTSEKPPATNVNSDQSLPALAVGVTVELSYSSTEFAYSGSANGYSYSVQMMESKLGGQIQSFSKSNEPPVIFESNQPSPERVAERILGFVESRIEKESKSGASEEQLSKLFTEGLEGVNQGYGQALEEINQRGLLTDKLGEEIDGGYKLIESGFDALRDKYLSNREVGSERNNGETIVNSVNAVDSARSVKVTEGNPVKDRNSSVDPLPVIKEKTGAIPDDTTRLSGLSKALAFSRSQYATDNVGINLTTKDGDQINIRVGQQAAQSSSLGYFSQDVGESLSYSNNSFQLEALNLQIDGDLDEGELKALESLLLQVEDIAGSFFNGDLEQAFAVALEMDVDMSEIASYAVTMTSLRYQAVESAYQQPPAEVDAFRPLTRLVPQFANALADASEFMQPKQLINDLIDRMLQSGDQLKPSNADLFSKFKDSVVERLVY